MREYHVVILYSEQLKRDVHLYIMVPKTYFKTLRRFPVLYMHDGQNLFDGLTSYGGNSWGLLEAYEERPDLPEVIIVGIENGGEERSNELVPFTFNFTELGYPEYGGTFGGKTDLYFDFIINDVKKYIDSTYRTYKSPNNTGIMGSSFGGVCSTYAMCKYTDYFSKFGCVSNAFYVIQEQMENLLQESSLDGVKKVWLDTGTKESSSAIDNKRYIESNNAIYSIIKDKVNSKDVHFELVKDAVHNESAWAQRVGDIIQFLFND